MLINNSTAQNRARGFTVIELLVIIAVLGILAAIVIFVASSNTERSNRSRILSDLQILDQATALYSSRYGQYPGSMQALADAGYIVAPPVLIGMPDVSYERLKIGNMSYQLTSISGYSSGSAQSGVFRARLSGAVYATAKPSSKTASVFTIEQLIDGGW